MRVFIGIGFDVNVLDYLESVKDYLKPSVYQGDFINYNNAHITLKYIGQVNDNAFEDLLDILDTLKDKVAPFPIKIGDIGTFNRGRKKILYVNVLKGKEALQKLYKHIETMTTNLGFEPDQRKYHPHITLARKVIFNERVNTYLKMPLYKDSILIKTITLYQSHRVNDSLTYTPLYTIALKQ